jgi:hypothetical protein
MTRFDSCLLPSTLSFVLFVKPNYPLTFFNSLIFISKKFAKVPTLRLEELNNNQIFVATTRYKCPFLRIIVLIVPTVYRACIHVDHSLYMRSILFSTCASLSVYGKRASYGWVNEPGLSLFEYIFQIWCAFCQALYRVIQQKKYLKVSFSLHYNGIKVCV